MTSGRRSRYDSRVNDPSELRIPLATFKRVFDVEPAHEVVSLPQLIATLTRFELKPEVQRRVDRELERVEVARKQLASGMTPSGRFAARLSAARDDALKEGATPAEALDRARIQVCTEVRRKVKQDLRLWSPALYRAGGRRQKEDVTHVSCLVMDHDDGTPIEVVQEVWAPWFHIVHTTWSHQDSFPRFRIILPLSEAIEADRWERVYTWAIERSEGVVDPTGRGRASTFALPVVPNLEHPRHAYSHAGALLDPVAEGLIAENHAPDSVTLDAIVPPAVSFTGDPTSRYTDTPPHAGITANVAEPLEDQALWDAVAAPAYVPPGTVAQVRAVSADTVEALLQRIVPSSLAVDALERLEGLRDRGTLTRAEFDLAKAAVLADLRVHRPDQTS